jgi:putative aminopeptidase FrvX
LLSCVAQRLWRIWTAVRRGHLPLNLRRYLPRVAILSSLVMAQLLAQDELCGLANLHAPAGREQAAALYVRQRLGDRAETDNTGSVSIRYGSGAPHTLLIAGLDEPGYIVSGVSDEGYLRLQRLADPVPHYQFDTFFQGWPVQVTTRSGSLVSGVVAAPSVHFDSNTSAARGVASLFVDLGASSREEVSAAGVGVLDAVTLDKECSSLGEGREASAPWISSRAGAAVLLRLAGLLERQPPRAAVTLAFVGSQYYHNIGLQRIAARVPADRVVVLRPSGNDVTAIGAASGATSGFAAQLLERAGPLSLQARRADAPTPPLGPFGPKTLWRDSQQVAVISPAVQHSGTPAEVVDRADLERLAELLAQVLEIEWRAPAPDGAQPASGSAGAQTSGAQAGASVAAAPASPRPSPQAALEATSLAFLIQQLCEIYGVSGAENPVRAWIQKQLPAWTRDRASVDKQGNLIVQLGRRENPQAVFIAHMDEIGFEVTRDAADRSVPAESRGGGMAELFAWHPFWVHAATRRLPAVMTRHGSLDIGAAPGEASARVAGGDTATVRKQFRRLLGNRITARSLDDRVGCAALLALLQSLDAAQVRRLDQQPPVWIVFSVEEESGLVGARFLAERTSPKRVYPVDSFVTSDSPLEEKHLAHARLGDGFVVRAMDTSGIAPRDAVERVVELARRNNIPYQLGVTAGGNDGSTFVPHGAVNLPLSFPLRYAHSPGEVADLRDAEALRSILAALLKSELAAEENPR